VESVNQWKKMSRENTYAALVLKKQPLNEADELITVFTKEIGKLRVLAKSVKFAKSKLQYSLQSLFLVNLTVTGGGLPKIIGVEVVNLFFVF
jgi:DNA repair protein RecO (recombination protein O)